MIWGKALPERLLALTDSIDLGAGFRYITDRPPPEHINSLVYDYLSTMELIKAAKMLGAVELKDYKPKKKQAYWVYDPDIKNKRLFGKQ
jgi:hypothetical protein